MEVFYHGGIYMLAGCGLGISYIIGCCTVVPLLYPLRITSVYEYLDLRFQSKVVRTLCTVVGMLTTLCYMAIALLSPALALQASANLSLWVSIAGFGAVASLYTAIGGFKSVVWTDVFQTLVIFVGIAVILIKATLEVGGLSEVWRLSQAGGRTHFDRFTPDPRVRHSIWGLLVGHCFMWLVNEFNQSTLQRISSMRSVRDAQVSHLMLTPLIIVYSVIFGFMGLTIFAYFRVQDCDPLAAGFISNRNQLAPFFVVHLMQDVPGMVGLYVSVLCCASLSTLSSGINALAANTVEDILQRPLQGLREATIVFLTKLIAVAYGVVTVGLTFMANRIQGPILQMLAMVFSAFGSPVLGIFVLGACVPWANKYGALTGAVISLVFNLWISVGNALHGNKTKPLAALGTAGCRDWAHISEAILFVNETYKDRVNSYNNSALWIDKQRRGATEPQPSSFPLYEISYEWHSMLGTFLCFALGLSVSYVTNRLSKSASRETRLRKESTHACYIFPFLRKFWGMSDAHSPSDVARVKVHVNDKPQLGDDGQLKHLTDLTEASLSYEHKSEDISCPL